MSNNDCPCFADRTPGVIASQTLLIGEIGEGLSAQCGVCKNRKTRGAVQGGLCAPPRMNFQEKFGQLLVGLEAATR